MASPHDEYAVALIKDSQIVGRTPSENLFIDHMVFCYMKRLCRVLSDILYYWEKEESKRLRSTM